MDELKSLLTPMFVEVMNQRRCEAGPVGPPGLPGRDGRDGAPGGQGRDGVPGLQGPIGERGLKGDVGIGIQGEVGPPGMPGRDGRDGGQGPTGEKGLKGDVGNLGIQGEVGPPGIPGNDGQPGRDGVGQPGRDGRDGIPGLTGEKGLKGDVGVTGLPGQGQKGESGIPGSKGGKGEVGEPGPRGLQGEAGQVTEGFSAYKTSTDDNVEAGYVTTGVLTFDNTILGEDIFNKQTGTLKVKKSGVYIFHFSAEAVENTHIGVFLNDNTERQMTLWDNDSDNLRKNLSFTWTIEMNEGDKLQLKIDYGSLYVIDNSNTPHRVYFSGFLMKPSA